ncbi:MAG TPA: serine hydroxymethyltransferase [Acidimicrobiales bacterium]
MSSTPSASPFSRWLSDDPDVLALLGAEAERQATTLQLIASENFTSTAVLAATGSILTNKYAEGYPGRRYYGGNQVIDEVEDLARDRLKSLLGAEHANVQPHAGSNANLAAYLALIKPGDTVLAMRLDHGGHLTHGSPASITSKVWNFVSYGVSAATDDADKPGEIIDFDQVADLARTHRPQLIVAGSTAYARIIDPLPFREIADSVGAKFMFDAAHPAGLIAGGVHPSPVGVADVVTFTTHKTLRGPRGGAIVCKAEYAKAIDSAIFPGLQGGPLENVIAGKAVAFAEAARPEFAGYAAKVVANAKSLATAVAAEGIRLVSGGTENHQVLCDLRSFDPELTGKVAQEVLDRAGITCNRNTIPDDPRSPFITSGLRLGTAALTTTGMGEGEMARVGALIGRTLRQRDDDTVVTAIRAEVRELCAAFPPYPGLAGA